VKAAIGNAALVSAIHIRTAVAIYAGMPMAMERIGARVPPAVSIVEPKITPPNPAR